MQIPSSKKREKKGTGIQVFARFRPQNSIEAKNNGQECVQFDQDEKTIAIRSDKDQDQVRHSHQVLAASDLF